MGIGAPSEQDQPRTPGELALSESERWRRALRQINENVAWWLRPFATLAFLLVAVLEAFALLGLRAFSARSRREGERALDVLRGEAEGIWAEGRTDDAVDLLLGVFAQLEDPGFGAKPVPPYGRFDGVTGPVHVGLLAYDYAMLAKRWGEAADVLGKVIESAGEELVEASLITKYARALTMAGRSAEAKEVLLRNLDPSQTDSEMHRLLDDTKG